MSTESDDRKANRLRKAGPHIDGARPTSGTNAPRSYASAAADDAASKRQADTQPATRPGKEKLEQRPPKHPQENHISSSTSDEHHGHEHPVDPQPATTTESASKKALPATGDPAHNVRRGPHRPSPNPQTGAQLPAGAAPADRFDHTPRHESQTSGTTVVTITSPRALKAVAAKNKPDDVPAATPSVPDSQPEVDAEAANEHGATTAPEAEDRQMAPPDVDEGEDSRNHSDSEATSTTAVVQDGAGLTSGMFGGIANALGMRPPTAREARLDKDNHKLRGENKFLRSEYHKLETAARKYYNDAIRFHHESQRLQESLEAISLEVKGVTKRYEEAKSLSETRGKELLGAQVFLTKADGLSVSELIQKVDGLNDEIYQAAASLGESIVQKKVESSEQGHYSSEESSIAKTLLGSPLCKVLRSRARKIEEGINPLLVQITLQAFFVVFCAHRIGSWIPSHLEFDATLQELYEKIWFSSDQAVSGRWRSLTRAQLKPDTNEWIKELMTDLDAILALASWEVGSPEDKHTLEARLPAIFKVVLDVREAIGEKFTSADIEVTCVETHTPFNKAYMEEPYAADSSEGHEKDPEIVISTVGMGVRKVVSVHGGRGYEYVLGPKVVLESSLKAVLEPPPPRATRQKNKRS